MAFRPLSSRRRFTEYKYAARHAAPGASPGDNGKPPRPHAPARATRSFLRLLCKLWGLFKNQRAAIAFALATLTLSTVLKLIPPAASKITIDYVLAGQPLPDRLLRIVPLPSDRRALLGVTATAVVVLSLLNSVIHLWGRWHATRANKRLQAAVRRHVFEHTVRLPLNRVYQLKSGGVASLLREDAGEIGNLIFDLLYNPWRAFLQLLGSFLVLAWLDWRLLLGTIVLVPLIFVTHRTWINRIRPLHRDIRAQRQEIDGHATEAFGGMRVVRAFGRQRSETARFTLGNHLLARQELNAWWWARIVEGVWAVIIPIASAALLLYGGFQVLEGRLSLGDLMMFLVYLMMLLGPIEVLASSATELQSGLAALDRVLDLLEEPREMPDPPQAIALSRHAVPGRIELQNVSFHYPGVTDLVVHDLSLVAEPGQMIALVGPSGAGKTTLCNLIARFYDPTQGSIQLDGTDLPHIQLDSYRSLLGIVEQEIFLFDGTVGENIGYAVRHARAADIERAAQLANAHEFIAELERGYDTLIGERGVRLSGGQRQRIAIARAVLADPRILILDEATSNLDTESERLIQHSLRVLMRGRTTFVIAHRLSTIAHADLIVVLEAGRIVEVGTHATLMAASGRYRHMVRVQTGAISLDSACLAAAPRAGDMTLHVAPTPPL